jgi:hypothetical protein
MIGEPQKLLKGIENGKLSETAIAIIEKMELDALTHLEANKKSAEKPWDKESLREEIRDKTEDLKIKSKILEETNLIVGEQKERIR